MFNTTQDTLKKNRALVFFILLLLSACGKNKVESVLQLPPGNAINGQLVFAEMHCIECHTLVGNDYIDEIQAQQTSQSVAKQKPKIELGIETTRIKTHAELVTSIINPSHKLAEGYNKEDVSIDGMSIMPSYNDVMTVDDLIDLVEFLHTQYDSLSIPLLIYPDYQIK